MAVTNNAPELWDDIVRLIRRRYGANEDIDSLRIYAMPNERVFECVTMNRRFRYNPQTRTLDDISVPPPRFAGLDIRVDGTLPNNEIALEHPDGRVDRIIRLEEVPVNNANLAPGVYPAVTVPEQPRDVIQVIVRRDDYGGWGIGVRRNGTALPLPDINVIKSLLPPEWKRLLGGRHSRRRRTDYYLQQALNSGLPTQVLHDALQAWAFTWVSATTSAVSETAIPAPTEDESFLLKAQPATIFVGGKSYKLVPTGERNNTNIYRHIRDKAKAIAEIEVQAKLDKAQTDARILISEAQSRVSTMRQEVEQLRASIGNQAPEWARQSGRPIKLMDGRWWIRLNVPTYLEDIRYRVGPWQAILHWNPVRIDGHDEAYYRDRPMPMWFMLDTEGRYTMSSVRSDIWQTVHTSNRACMELQGIPARIIDSTSLTNLERAVSRGIRVINFNSPLSYALDRFYPLYVEQLPDMVKRIITSHATLPENNVTIPTPAEYLIRVNEGRQPNNLRMSWDRVETDATELNYTFTVPATIGTERG